VGLIPGVHASALRAVQAAKARPCHKGNCQDEAGSKKADSWSFSNVTKH